MTGALLTLTLSSCVRTVDCGLAHSSTSGTPSIVLSNRYLQAETVPAALGGVAGLRWLPGNLEMMIPFKYSVETHDLIPDRPSATVGGKILIWGRQNLMAQPMTVTGTSSNPEKCGVEFVNPYYQGTSWRLERRIELERDTAALVIEMTVINTAAEPATVTLWENLVAQLDAEKMDAVIIPVRGQIHKVGSRGVQFFPEDTLFIDDAGVKTQVIFTAPARNWIARRNPKTNLILALRTNMDDLLPQGLFYVWKQMGGVIHSMEIIFSPIELAPGKSKDYRLEYMVFAGLTDLKEICGDIGINCEAGSGTLDFQMTAARKIAAQSVTISLINDTSGTKIAAGSHPLSVLMSGITDEFSLPLPTLPPGQYHISGEFDDGAIFTLLSPKVKIR